MLFVYKETIILLGEYLNEKIGWVNIYKIITLTDDALISRRVLVWHTTFSVTTENVIGTIKDAPPPMEIPLTRATCQIHMYYVVRDLTKYYT